MRSARFTFLVLFLFSLAAPVRAAAPAPFCRYQLGDVAHVPKSLSYLRNLAAMKLEELEALARGQSPIELLRTANDIVDAIRTNPKEESALSPVAIELAKLAGAKATQADRLDLLRWLLNRAESAPQDWEQQFLLNEIVDATAGLDTRALDAQVMALSDAEVARRFGNEQTWFRFGNRDLLTPYFEFMNILHKLAPKPGERITLLGSGVGREAIPTSIRYPGVQVNGYEIVGERVAASEALRKHLGLKDVQFQEQNLADPGFKPEPADYYYAFNPVSGTTFDKILSDLKSQAEKHNRPFHIVVSGPAPYEKFTRKGSGFVEVTPLGRFEQDSFSRIFHYNPKGEQPERSLSSIAEPGDRRERVPAFPDFVNFGLEDLAWIKQDLQDSPATFAHNHYPHLWAWQGVKKAQLTKILGLPTLASSENGRRVFSEPLTGSTKEKAAAIRFALLATRPGETPPKFEDISEAVATELRALGGVRVTENPARADYVYRTETLSELAIPDSQPSTGPERKRVKDKKLQALSFREQNPRARYRSFSKGSEEFAQVKEFLNTWKDARADKLGEEGLKEVRATANVLEQMDSLGYEGRLIELDGKVIAFSLGQKSKDDTFTIYAQKADPAAGPSAGGVYPFFFQEQAKELRARKIAYINLESDEGVEGLRRMKKSLGPDHQVLSFEAEK